ncbi:MAG: hypothetical protein U1E76_21040 [Planctomycetota bacterium]
MSDPAAIEDLVLQGEAWLLDDEIEDAVLAFLQAVRLDPGNHDAALGLGHAMLARGDVAGALQRFAEMIARDPRDTAAAAGLKECLDQDPLAAGSPGGSRRPEGA